jgi:hypothetical protein
MLAAARQAERDADRSLGPLGRQRGESRRAYNRRFSNMSREERDEVVGAGSSGPDIHELRDVLKQVRDDLVPWRWVFGSEAPPPLGAVIARYRAAEEAADARWHDEVAATPVDDAAWERELKRRQECEDDEAHPERFIHFI